MDISFKCLICPWAPNTKLNRIFSCFSSLTLLTIPIATSYWTSREYQELNNELCIPYFKSIQLWKISNLYNSEKWASFSMSYTCRNYVSEAVKYLCKKKKLVSGKCFSWMSYMKNVFLSSVSISAYANFCNRPPTLSHAPGVVLCSAKINKSTNSQFFLQVSPSPWDRSFELSAFISWYCNSSEILEE